MVMLVLGVALGILLAGCGGATKTVTVASTPLPEQTTTAPRTSTTTTRTAPEPAFTHQGTGTAAEGLSGAEAVLQARGFTANATSDYHSNQTLRVLIGTRTGSAGEGGQQAFFFVGGHYIGTDSKQPSASIHLVSQGDTEVTLAYSLSGARQATVRFQLNNGKLTPLDPIPSASSRQ